MQSGMWAKKKYISKQTVWRIPSSLCGPVQCNVPDVPFLVVLVIQGSCICFHVRLPYITALPLCCRRVLQA